jgi:hypothetical protein
LPKNTAAWVGSSSKPLPSMPVAAPKKNTALFVCVLAILGYAVFRYKNLAEQGSLQFKWKLKLQGTFFNPKIIAFFDYINPTDVTVDVTEIKGDIFYKEQSFATVNEIDQITISPNSTTSIPVEINTTLKDLLQTIWLIVGGRSTEPFKPSDFQFTGYFKALGIKIPVDQTLSI